MLQGKKHADNPWIQKITARENQAELQKKIRSGQIKKTQDISGIHEGDKEADIIAKEFTLEIFKIPDKRECRQLSRYDTWQSDLTPEEWLKKCENSHSETHALSPVYNGVVYIWQPVKVIGYDPAKKKFKVLVIESQQIKLVSRLSLLFNEENKEDFYTRLNQCKDRREIVENELRFQEFVDGIIGGICSIPAKVMSNISDRAQMPENKLDQKEIDNMIGRLMPVIDAIYRRTMKKCILIQEMSKSTSVEKFEELKIPTKFTISTVKYMGVIDVGRILKSKTTVEDPSFYENFPECRPKSVFKLEKRAGKILEVKEKRIKKRKQFALEAENEIIQRSGSTKMIEEFTDKFQGLCEEFKKRRLFQTDYQRLQLPMRCSQFINIQDKKIKATTIDILNNWRFQLLHDMREKLVVKSTKKGEKPSKKEEKTVFDIPDMKVYEESLIKKLIRKYDLMFHYHLGFLYTESINDFVQFIQQFTMPKNLALWKLNSFPLIKIDIRYPGSDKKKEEKKEDKKDKSKHKHKKDDKKNKEVKKKEKKELFYKPDIAACKKEVVALVDKVCEITGQVTILETEDFNVFLSGRKSPAYPLSPESPFIVRAKEEISKMMDECMVEPLGLLQKFKKYEFLMTATADDMRKMMNKEKPPTPDELRMKLDELSRAAYEVQTLATDSVEFSMFEINTSMVKQFLVYRANKLKGSLLQVIEKYCKKTVADISTKYGQLLEKLENRPTSKEHYKELKMYNKDSNKRMEELKSKHEQVGLYMDILEDNLKRLDKDDEREFWKGHQFPSQLKAKFVKCSSNLLSYEEFLRSDLEKQKDSFDKELGQYQAKFAEVIQFSDIESAKKQYRTSFELHAGIEKAVLTAKGLNDDEDLLETKKTEYGVLDKLGKDFQPFFSLIKYAEEIQSNIEGWKTNPFFGLKPQDIEEDIKSWLTNLEILHKQLEETKDQSDVAIQLKDVVNDFKQHLELIKCLRSEAIKEEELNDICKATSLTIKYNDDTLNLNGLIKKNAESFMEQIREISERAERKLDLDKVLKKMKDDMSKKKLEVVKHGLTNTYIIQSYEPVLEAIDEQIASTQTMLNSPYMSGQLKKTCQAWGAKLGSVSEILEELKKCQKTWMYLKPIFSEEDIRLTLKREGERFADVDIKWVQQMENINAENLVVSLLDKDRLKEEFARANEDLEGILKSLADFLESIRKKFPRFYFISDEDLVKIMSCAKQDLLKIQPYLNKCFEAVNCFEVSENDQKVVGICSSEKEKIKLLHPLELKETDKKKSIELWLSDLEKSIFASLKDYCSKAIKDYGKKPRMQWIFEWPCQLALVADQIHWCSTVDNLLRENKGKMKALESLESKMKDQIVNYVEMVRGEITVLQRCTLEALLVLDVHAKDIIHLLISKGVADENAFDWSAQMRYEYVKEEVKVNMLTASLTYGFEYIGSSSRLVITPATDRCYRTLMLAKKMKRGGALEGPAGTGKTETVKDLAKALGIYCVVFNGSDELDHIAMAKFFKGIASAGAWCCFDEFNKIELDVLSVIASHILMIQQALNLEEKIFRFIEEDVALNPLCGINITMNPISERQTELPDNLKALFRTCALTLPDHGQIAEILLYSYGFQEARSLSRKIVTVLRLCREQLSSLSHYDFGMRALKTVLTTAKSLKKHQPTEKEEVLARRALNEVNLPKFTLQDSQLYDGIATDLFPGLELKVPENAILRKVLIEVLQKEKHQAKEQFVKKCLEIYETLLSRHGMMVIGESLSGKTTAINALKKTLSTMAELPDSTYSKVITNTLNPKAITFKQLYGNFEEESRVWTDGVLSLLIRDIVESDSQDTRWIVFDGPVDTIWMESMNTVLDESKKLCLSSGAVIKLKPSMALLFEVEDLKYASPAIVSRCGMVYMECQQLGWEILVKSYCETLPLILTPKRIKQIEDSIISLIIPIIAFMNKHCKLPIPMKIMHLVNSFLNMFECFVVETRDQTYKLAPDIESFLNNCMIFSAIWGFGGSIEEANRVKFHEFLIDLLSMIDVKIKYKLDVEVPSPKISVKFPEGKNVFSLAYLRKGNAWKSWTEATDTVPYQIPKTAKFHEIIVPTTESERMSSLLRTFCTSRKNLLFVGPTGTSKTISISSELKKTYLNSQWTSFTLNLSAQTSSNQVQRMIECKLEKRGRKVYYGPSHGKHGVVFIDDLNLPQKDQFEAQPPIELLRQWMDYGGWYEIESEDRKFKFITDISFIAAMTPSASGNQDINYRYLSHYNVIYVDNYQETTLTKIFTEIAHWAFHSASEEFIPEVSQLAEKLVESTVEIYLNLPKEQDLRPTPSKPHYAFNLRDVAKVMQGVCRMTTAAIKKPEDLIKLWAHESIRVFQDRLVSLQDKEIFMKILKNTMKKGFDKDWENVVTVEPLIFCDFVKSLIPGEDKSKEPNKKIYCEVTDRAQLKSVAESFLENYNKTQKSKLNIVLFLDAIEHVIGILRVLSLPKGHALLIGVGGSGRKSLALLASFIGNFEIFHVGGSRHYMIPEWRADLRALMSKTGVENIPTVFLLGDSEFQNETFFEDLNNLLNTGEVPNLYTKTDNKEDLMTKLREAIQARYKEMQINNDEILQLLKEHSMENLHVVFCMSPIGDHFRQRLRTFPSLVNSTTITYFWPWPEEGLRSVAMQSFANVEGLEKEREGMISICVDMQERVRLLAEKYKNEMQCYYYVTPTSYLELLKIFKKLLEEKKGMIVASIKSYENGLEELHKTESFVALMKTKLIELEPELKKKNESALQLADSLKKKQNDVAEETKVVQKEQEKSEETKKIADQLQAECQAEFDKAMPELKEAEGAIGSIKPEAIADLAAMGAPRDEVKLVAKALSIILDIKPKKGANSELDYWQPKKIFTFKSIKKCAVEFDKDNIPLAKITELKKIYEDPGFASEKLASVSGAGEMLARWIRAIIKYDQINRIVAPKKATLKEESEKAKAAHDAWNQKNKQLEEKRALLNDLNQKSQSAEAQKRQLAQEIEGTRKKIERAQEILDLMKNENKRWNDQRNELQERQKHILGDMLISSGIIAYLGAFPANYRESCIESWFQLLQKFGIIKSDNFSLFNALGDPLQKLSWQKQKLPTDSISTDNAIILERSSRWPLMIDPQRQAVDWIKRKGPVEIIKQSQRTELMMKKLASCMSSGLSVLMEEFDKTVDSALMPLLKKETQEEGKRRVIKLGEDNITLNSSFMLYLTTKLPRPHYSPEICSLVTILNFIATDEGLMDQMLNIIVKKEEPNTEKGREDVINKSFDIKKKLKIQEEEILKIVTVHKEGILESEKLIETLKNTKNECQQFTVQVDEQKRLSEKIENTRSKFKTVAKRVADLYFCVSELSSVESMYQFSLEWYLELYQKALQTEHDPEGGDKLETYKTKFTYMLFNSVCKSLFEKDKLLFTLSLYIKIALSEGKNSLAEVRFLAAGPSTLEATAPKPTMEDWLSDRAWRSICEISQKLPAFKELDKNIAENLSEWKKTCKSSDIIYESKQPWPSKWGSEEKLNALQRLILVNILRPDKFVEATQELIATKLGKPFCEYPPFNLEEAYNNSSNKKPIIIILSPGADPLEDLKALAIKQNLRNNLVPLSLGKGQGKKAILAIEQGLNGKEAGWVLLQNCHLATSYLSDIEKMLDNIPEDQKSSFRLWLTTNPSNDFPVTLLQSSIKLTNERPKGVIRNMLQSYSNFDPSILADAAPKSDSWRKILFSLCFFHATIIERVQFGSLGWNIPYQFSIADLQISIDQIQSLLKLPGDVPWEALQYLVADTNYGGRISDAMDLRCIQAMFSDCCNPDALKEKFQYGHKKEFSIHKGLKTKEDFLKHIKGLPAIDDPELFGLNETAKETCAINDANQIQKMLLSLLPRTEASAPGLRESEIASKAQAILKEIPKEFDLDECSKKYPILYTECMNSVLEQEIEKYNNLIKVIKKSLIDLQKAIKGYVVMSPEIEAVAKNIIYNNTVPEIWKQYSYPSMKPLFSWIKDLGLRVQFFQDWIEKNPPIAMWLPAFFFPQSFFTGVMQNCARKTHLAFDDLCFDHIIMNEPKEELKKLEVEGCYVYGLFIEGAKWEKERKCLGESEFGVLTSPAPCVMYKPVEASKYAQDKTVSIIY